MGEGRRARATYEGLILVQCCVCTACGQERVSSTLCHGTEISRTFVPLFVHIHIVSH